VTAEVPEAALAVAPVAAGSDAFRRDCIVRRCESTFGLFLVWALIRCYFRQATAVPD
jgi:hypothetical protein